MKFPYSPLVITILKSPFIVAPRALRLNVVRQHLLLRTAQFLFTGLKKTLNILVFPSGAEMKQTPALNIFDIRAPPGQGPVRRRELPKDKYNNSIPVKTLWGFLDEYIITGKLSRMI